MNKLTKLLSVFLIAGAIGAGFAGVAGCKKNNACNHIYGVQGEDNGDGTHKLTCTKCKEGTAGHTKDEAHKDTDNDGNCNVCGAKMNGDEKEYEVTEYYCDFKNSSVASYNSSSSKTPNEINIGKFTIGKNVYVETKSEYGTHGNVNTQKQDKAVLFSFDGEDGKNFISFKAKGANAGDVAKLCKADGTVVASFTLTASVADYSAGYNFETGAAGDVVIGKGDYYLGVNTSSRIGNLLIKEYVEKSPIVSLKLSGGKRQFAKGDTFSAEGLNVTGVKENGAEVPVTGFTHNGSTIDMSTTGEKTVTVSYTPAGATTPITQTYKINVVDITGIQVNAEFMRKVYIKGETSLDTGNLCVYNIFGNDVNNVERATGVTVDATTYDLTAAGTYTLKIKAGAFDNTDVKITVLENKAQVTNNAVTVAVDANAASEGVSVGGVATFTTVTNAIDYLEASSLDAGVIKTVKIAAGTYREKVTTSLPNLVLWGTGATTDATTLVYNVVEGMKDPVSGNAWSLNAATLTVKGKNFKAYNLHISNDFNYIADNKKYADPQGLAVRSESDQAVLYKCHLSGNQDTLYVKEGRMYAYETQVDGNIDFIFGENKGSLYLEKCTVKAISRNGGKNEGYVTAWKGTGAAVNCIFDNCVITSDDKVGAQCMTLGRTWGAKASVAIINSKISKAYSKYAYGGASDGYKARYENMNGSPAEAKFVEYNNTGIAADNDGAISASIAGVTVLDAAGAANYTKAKIFAAANGDVTWSGAWDCDGDLTKFKAMVSGTTLEEYTLTIKNVDGGAAIGTKTYTQGSTVMVSDLIKYINKIAAVAEADKEVDKIYSSYTDASTNTELTANYTITASDDIFVTLKAKDHSVKAGDAYTFDTGKEASDINFTGAVAQGDNATFGKLTIFGGTVEVLEEGANKKNFFADNGGTWYKIKGDASLSFTVSTPVRISVLTHDKGLKLCKADGTPIEAVDSALTMKFDLTEAGVYKLTNVDTTGVGGQHYVGSINFSAVPEKDVTVTLYDTAGASPVAVGAAWALSSSDLVNVDKLDTLRATLTVPEGKTFDAYYKDADCTQKFNPATDKLAAGTQSLYIGWKTAISQITETTTIKFGSAGDYTSYVNQGIMTLSGDWSLHDSSVIKTNNGTVIRIKADESMTVSISWHSNGSPTDANRTIEYDSGAGEWVITVIADATQNGRLYMYSVTLTANS